jgi:Fe-S-cluster containining protein
MQSFDFDQYNEQLRQKLSCGLNSGAESCFSEVMASFIDEVEEKLAQNLTPFDHEMLACAAGCGSCCKVNVAVLQPEAFNISTHLRQTRSVVELEQLKQEMHQLVHFISDLDEEERIALNKSCSFLTADGNCSIYPVRPLMCRSITSIDANDCREALAMRALGEQLPITMNLFQKNLFDGAFKALAQALNSCGLDDRSQELTAAVLAHLEE